MTDSNGFVARWWWPALILLLVVGAGAWVAGSAVLEPPPELQFEPTRVELGAEGGAVSQRGIAQATVEGGPPAGAEEDEFAPFELPETQLSGPKAKDRQVTLVVKQLIRHEHLLKERLDDLHAQRGLQNFLKALDPMKVYFVQSDIDEFRQQENQLDDQLRDGEIDFAYTVFNRFLSRVNERVKLVEKLVRAEHDFTVDEDMLSDPDVTHYSGSDQEVFERWRKRIKYDLLVLKADETEQDDIRPKLLRRYRSFAKRMYQTDSDELLEMYLTSMTTSFDPHTTYMSASSLDNFHIMMRLKLEGIGAALQVVDGYTVVNKVIPNGAADKQGDLKPEDRIVSVGQGDEGDMVDVVDTKLSDVVKLIRGKAGTIVRLGVNPSGIPETRVYKITRAKIELTDSEARGVVFEKSNKDDGTPFRVGVIDLPSFYMDMNGAREGILDFKSTTRDVRRLLDGFRAQKLDAVILDLRRNGGGSLTEAINLTGLFIDRGVVVQVEDSAGNSQEYADLEAGMAWDGPLVVLTSKFSASASEIFAGAIQDYRRGIVVGDRSTHGKGTVQSLLDLGSHLFHIPNPPNLGALKITMQQFFRPNGESTQMRGVLSDIVLPSLTDQMNVAEMDLDYAIDFHQIAPAEFVQTGMVNDVMLGELRDRSGQRLEVQEDFAELRQDIESYVTQKDRQKISINEEKFFALRAEFDADKEEEKQFEEDPETDRIVDRNFYFEEVLDITVDYVRLLGKRLVNRAVRRG